MKKIFKFILAIILIFNFTFAFSYNVLASEENKNKTTTKEESHDLEMSVYFKGMERNKKTGGGTLKVESGGAIVLMKTYVGIIFRFSAGLIVIIAVIMIIVGGLEIMFKGAAGDISTGKDRIIQALLGLVLVFLSALILHTINPSFFTFV